MKNVVPLAGDVDRNVYGPSKPVLLNWSSPSRGTWIEIARQSCRYQSLSVVPLAGDVDRNWIFSS